MFYLIGLGLSWKDLSLKALEALNSCDKVYLETYTSLADFSPLRLSRLLGKKVIPLGRKQVEDCGPKEDGRSWLKEASLKNVALLIYGDPLSATTHLEILNECKKKKINYKVLQSSSVLTAVGATGLSLYKFGKTASKQNQKIGAHTLFLLDLKPDQNRFLTIPEAIQVLLKIAKKRQSKTFSEKTLCIGCARLGSDKKTIKVGTAKELLKKQFGAAPYCLIVPSKLAEYENVLEC